MCCSVIKVSACKNEMGKSYIDCRFLEEYNRIIKVSAHKNEMGKSCKELVMCRIDRVCETFSQYGGMMRTNQLSNEKIYYKDIQDLIQSGYVEKIRTGYYQWIDHENLSEVSTVTKLFPDGIFCMETALRHYGYSDRTPSDWNIAVNKNSNKTRFNIDYPFVKPYYVAPTFLEVGVCEQVIDGNKVRMYDKERTICDCLRYRNKMDREIFNKAIQNYINDSTKNIPKLMEYAEKLRVKKLVKDLIGVWL